MYDVWQIAEFSLNTKEMLEVIFNKTLSLEIILIRAATAQHRIKSAIKSFNQ